MDRRWFVGRGYAGLEFPCKVMRFEDLGAALLYELQRPDFLEHLEGVTPRKMFDHESDDPDHRILSHLIDSPYFEEAFETAKDSVPSLKGLLLWRVMADSAQQAQRGFKQVCNVFAMLCPRFALA